MSGVTGWIDFSRDLSLERPTLEAMTGTLRRRGPDDEGLWIGPHAALGHRRLAVVDVEGGRQPMVARRPGLDDAAVVLTYSGEIYNFRELRTRLAGLGRLFRTSSDTEVVLHAYLEWGAAFVDRLTGMFAMAIWDGCREELLLVRDRLGVKPLYYHAYPGGLLFGSEPKAILANPLFTARTSERKLPILLDPRLTMPGETPFTGMSQVQPGHLVRIDRTGVHETPYWRLVSREHHDDHAETVRNIREILEDIVVHQLVADVPLCTLLSGGLNSSAVAALATLHRNDGLRSYTVDFEGADAGSRPGLRPEGDTPFALAAAGYLRADHTTVALDPAVLPESIPAALAARDLPSLGRSDTSMYRLFQEVRKHSTVALSGEGGDEVFGGRSWFSDQPATDGGTFPWLGDAPRLTDCLAPDVRARVRPDDDERDRYRTLLARVPRLDGESGCQARMREALYLGLHGPLPYLLERQDRMSMALGLEVRVPFCDHTLLEYVWNVPWKMRVAGGREESLLRSAVGDLLPQEVLWRRKSVRPATVPPEHPEGRRGALKTLLGDRTSPLSALLDHQKVRELADGGSPVTRTAGDLHPLSPLIEVDRWLRAYDVTLTA